jgi:hypothetical protein
MEMFFHIQRSLIARRPRLLAVRSHIKHHGDQILQVHISAFVKLNYITLLDLSYNPNKNTVKIQKPLKYMEN